MITTAKPITTTAKPMTPTAKRISRMPTGNEVAPPAPKLVSKTRNDLPAPVRAQMVALCNARLADCIDLQTQTKQAHWNVKGPSFIALHKLFDEVNESVEEYVDLIAERVAQLGGTVEGTARIVAGRSALPEYPHHISDGLRHVDALSTALGAFGAEVRRAIATAAEARDAGTSDIFTEISRGIDKYLWFVEVHRQATH